MYPLTLTSELHLLYYIHPLCARYSFTTFYQNYLAMSDTADVSGVAHRRLIADYLRCELIL
jgi:hypothetical protein